MDALLSLRKSPLYRVHPAAWMRKPPEQNGETRAFTCRLSTRHLRNRTVQNEILVENRLRHFRNGDRETLIPAAWAPSHQGALFAGKHSAPDFQDGVEGEGGHGEAADSQNTMVLFLSLGPDTCTSNQP